ncbi:MAG: hypothetical protein AAFS13_03605 [Pseudomonadota bacterium]
MKRLFASAALLLGTMVCAASASADRRVQPFGETVTGSDVVDFNDPSNVEGFGRLIRDRNGVTVELSTANLDPSRVNTVWWIYFNAPENCNSVAVPIEPITEGQRCTLGDLGDPNTEPGVIWASVAPVSELGIARVVARLVKDDLTANTPDPGLANPLTNPFGAEVLVDVRQHLTPGEGGVDILEQITTFEPFCEACATVQTTVFPGLERKRRYRR